MEFRKTLFNKLSTLSVSVPVSQQQIQDVLSKQVEEVEDIQVRITPEQIEISGYVSIKKFGLSRRQQVSLFLSPQRVESRILYFDVLKVKPLDFESSNAAYLTKQPLTLYEDRILQVDLSKIDTLKKVKFGSLRHLQLGHEMLTVGLGV
ncbi:hypothetical protein [Exiguobacterium undae]|uniref:hypothetical protein n=1 Tax=Exiguobacterium undae TaxID=169177 RepID=UPI00384BAFDC